MHGLNENVDLEFIKGYNRLKNPFYQMSLRVLIHKV